MMEVIRDEASDDLADLEDDHCFEGLSTSPLNAMESLSTDDESESSALFVILAVRFSSFSSLAAL